MSFKAEYILLYIILFIVIVVIVVWVPHTIIGHYSERIQWAVFDDTVLLEYFTNIKFTNLSFWTFFGFLIYDFICARLGMNGP